MKRAKFTDEQIVRILQEADRSPVAEVAKRRGVSELSIYALRKKFGGCSRSYGGFHDRPLMLWHFFQAQVRLQPAVVLYMNGLAFLLVVSGPFEPIQSRRNLTNRTSDGFHRCMKWE